MSQTLNPSAAAVALWMRKIDRGQLRDVAWLTIRERFPGLTDGASPFLLQHYADTKERQAAFDGFTFALLAVSHYQDLEQLAVLFTQSKVKESSQSSTEQKSTTSKKKQQTE